MQTATVLDPDDRTNPIAELSAREALLYHGTHSGFRNSIEKHGFSFEFFDRDFGEPIRVIVEACDTLYWKQNGYAAAKSFSDQRLVYFTLVFKRARDYASNLGSERIDGAIKAGEAFCKFARDPAQNKAHADYWRTALEQHGPHDLTEAVVANLSNRELVDRLGDQVENAVLTLKAAMQTGHPVVYAVQFDPAAGEFTREASAGVRLRLVGPERIVARIDYPNGVTPDVF